MLGATHALANPLTAHYDVPHGQAIALMLPHVIRFNGAVHRDVAYELEKYPEDKTEKDLERHVAPAIRAHMLDLLRCMETRERPVADIEQGHISTASCILANISLKLGRSLRFDPETHTVPGDAEATALLRRDYRAPWVHP